MNIFRVTLYSIGRETGKSRPGISPRERGEIRGLLDNVDVAVVAAAV